MKKWGHDELMHDLADHLRQPERMIWTDMQLGPSGSPRPDVFVMRKSYTQPKPMVYEIKVSVADFRSDITSGKWQSYLPFASGVYFACPAGMITKTDLPKGCGLIVRGDEGWRVLKAPTLQAVELDFHVMQKLLIDGVKKMVPEVRRRHWQDWLHQKEADKVLGKDVADALRDLQSVRQRTKHLQSEIDQKLAFAESRASSIVDNAKERADRLFADGNEAMADFIKFIGLTPGSSSLSIQCRVDEIKEQLSTDGMVRSLRDALNSIEFAVSRARKVIGSNDNNNQEGAA